MLQMQYNIHVHVISESTDSILKRKIIRKHAQTISTIEMLIKILAVSSCMVNFFCKSMAASNFCDERKSTQSLERHPFEKGGSRLD